jgi:hypothetical protein
VNKRSIWLQLARMALDIYLTPAMSDESERVFSIAGNTLTPRRRCLTSDAIQWLLCLRNWQNSGVVQFDQRFLRQATMTADSLAIDEINAYVYAQIPELSHEHVYEEI